MEHTHKLIHFEAVEKGVQLVMNLSALNHQCYCDSTRVQQIFWNLIKNAIKFTPRNGIVTITTTNPSPDVIVISVSDTGIGNLDCFICDLIF